MKKRKFKIENLFFIGALLFFSVFILSSYLNVFKYKNYGFNNKLDRNTTLAKVIPEVIHHIDTPKEVKALYMTSWIAGTSMRDNLVKILDGTPFNTVVIDVKDYSGKISFEVSNPELKKWGSEDVRVKDLKEFLKILHQKGIYTIARIAVFQDAYFVGKRPDLAVRTLDGKNVWKDRKGISWIDPGAREYWDYITLVSKEAYDIGFDELNFDYIRYPSDGDMKNIYYPWTKTDPKPETLKSFFSFLDKNFRQTGIKISADIFGMTTTATDDMGIGQVFENTIPYFDYIAPMVYPSHYPPNFEGFKNPAEHPYEVIHYAMNGAVERIKNASSTTDKLRPWIQDFDLGADYGVSEVKAQIKALSDLGINSFMVWSPSNKYTEGVLD